MFLYSKNQSILSGIIESSFFSTSYIKTLNTENQQAFDNNEEREKACIKWLKDQTKTIQNRINKAAFLGTLNGLLIIIQAGLLAFIFQQIIIEQQPWNQLLFCFSVLGVVFIARSLISYYFQVFTFKTATIIKQRVREQFLTQLSALGPNFSKQQSSGELATITLEQTEALESYYCRYLPQQGIVMFVPLLIVVAIFPVNWVVSVILLITGPLIPVFMMLIGMGAASASRQQFLVMSRMSGYFLDRLQGLATLKHFNYCQTELQGIKSVSNDFREKTMDVLRIAFLSSAVLEFFSALAVALVAVYVGLGLLDLINFGPAVDINLQQALFVLLLAPEFFIPLKKLATYYHDKAAAIAAADGILKVLHYPYRQQELPADISSLFCIELINVTKFYKNKAILKSFNLQIKSGEKIALTGESGVGKTTLLNLMLGFEHPDNGSVLINGVHASQQDINKNIAWAGQQSTVFYSTIKDNISMLNPDVTEQQIEFAAVSAGVTEFSDQLELGLLTRVGEKGYGLSGGQIQRILLARAFVANVDIILLDEPTAHLDEINKHTVLNAIDTLFKDKTLIIATHDSVTINRMARVIALT